MPTAYEQKVAFDAVDDATPISADQIAEVLMFVHVGRMHVVWSVAEAPTKHGPAMEDTSTRRM